MLKKLAMNMARSYYEDKPHDEDDLAIYAYGAEKYIAVRLELAAIVLLSLFVGRFLETIVFFAAFIPLRRFAGGYHAKDNLRCFLGFLMIYTINLMILFVTPIELIGVLLLPFAFISAFLVLWLAPLPDKNKPFTQDQIKGLRRKSVKLLAVQTMIIALFSLITIIFGSRMIVPINIWLFSFSVEVPFIFLGFALGQLSASGSLVATKIKNYTSDREVNSKV